MKHPGDEPVVVTGIGAEVAGASGVEEFWRNLAEGNSRIDVVPQFVKEEAPTLIGGVISDFDPGSRLPPGEEERTARFGRETQITMASVGQCVEDARLEPGDVPPHRTAMVGASSRGPLSWWCGAPEDSAPGRGRSGILHSLPGAPVSLASIAHGVQGTVTTISNGCVSGHQAVGIAAGLLHSGDTDAALVVGHDFPLLTPLMRLYAAMGEGALCRREDPVGAMRPYGRERDGFVLGEGAVTLCLERAGSARRRGARAYAEILGHRSRSEAAHPMTMDLSGQHMANLAEEVLEDAHRKPEDVGYVCGHGSATRYNDLAEARALSRLLPETSPRHRPPLGSVKPVYGHLLGGSGTLNVAAVALMLHHQQLAPTLNCEDPDPECGSDHVAEGRRPVRTDLALSLSSSLGSHSSVVALAAAA
ncbi:beta-ketoacyl-[acyl-carrier-protein] synthase family protein [Streptomyces sp. NPDC054796]